MKKLFLTGALLASAAAATYAATIRIEVDGDFVSGSVGPNSVSVTCAPGGCCRRYYHPDCNAGTTGGRPYCFSTNRRCT